MIDSFKQVTFEGVSPIAKAIGKLPSNFCDFSPFVILAWQKYYNTSYLLADSALILRHIVDGEPTYAPLSRNVSSTVSSLFDLLNCEEITVSILSEEDMSKLSECFDVSCVETDDGWSDYIYLSSDLSSFSGKRYSGQRNHINKFISRYPDWCYEKIDENNIGEVLSFYRELSLDSSMLNETALYERDMLIDYFTNGYRSFKLEGGLVRAEGDIVSFAMGEVIGDTLFVHIEKAKRDIQGAYQIIVREFSAHTPAAFINREEDMGLEGLRISKHSYHPIKLLKKYKGKIRKK